MNAQAAYGLLAHGLIFGAIFALLPLGMLRARAALMATTIALIAGIAPVMHGIFGTPSLTLLLLALLQLAGRTPSPLTGRAAPGLLLLCALFYPLSLGLGSFDPYTLGYQPWPLLAALLPLAIALWWRGQHTWVLILAIDLAGYASGIFVNLWDALIDPLLAVLVLIMVARRGVIRFIASRTR